MWQIIKRLFPKNTIAGNCDCSVTLSPEGEAKAFVVNEELTVFTGKIQSVLDMSISSNPCVSNGVRLLLDEKDFKSFPMEKPSVPKEAINDAIKWAAKEHLDVSINDLVFSWFEIPVPDSSGKNNCMVYCARKSIVSERGSEFLSRKIPILSVDIPDESWRNLSFLLGENGSYAFVVVGENSGRLHFFHDNLLVMSRRLPFGRKSIQDEDGLERAIIEIQRGVDFVERQYSKMFIGKMFIPGFKENDSFVEAIKSSLSMKVFLPDFSVLGIKKLPFLNVRDLELLGSAISSRLSRR